MDTVSIEEHRSILAEMYDWRTAFQQVKEQYDGLHTLHHATLRKLFTERVACAEAQQNDRIAMAWITDIKAAVGAEHMDMPQLVEYLKTIKQGTKP